MFGIGMPEMLLILAIALIVIGPKKLPDLAKSLGRAFGEFKKATNDLKSSFELDSDYKDVTHTLNDAATDIKDGFDTTIDSVEETKPESVSQDENDEEIRETSKEEPEESAESAESDEPKTSDEPDAPTDKKPPVEEGPDATKTEATTAPPEETQKDDRG